MSTFDAVRSSTETFVEWLKESVTNHLGEKCQGFGEGCPTCEAWALVDTLESTSEGDTQMIKVWCEYNIGGNFEDGHAEVFTTKFSAFAYLEKNASWITDGLDETLDDLIDQGLLTFRVISVK